jgi:RNA polymerase sigma-70 factor (sigma-E family)
MDGPSEPPGASERDRAVAMLFQAHAQELVRLAVLLTSDRRLAEELVQEAFLGLWRDWGRVRRHDAPLGYLRAVVVNQARTSLRRRLLELRHRVIGPLAPAEPDLAGRLAVREAVARLPMGKRACIALRFYADLTEEETARLLGISVGTVKSQTAKGLTRLAELLGDPAELPTPSRHTRR